MKWNSKFSKDTSAEKKVILIETVVGSHDEKINDGDGGGRRSSSSIRQPRWDHHRNSRVQKVGEENHSLNT